MADQFTEQQLAAKIRAKFPGAYDSVSDQELTQKWIAKYPEYKSTLAPAAPPEKPGAVRNAANNFLESWGMPAHPLDEAWKETKDLVQHPIDSVVRAGKRVAAMPLEMLKANGDVASKAYDELKKGDYGTGAADLIYSAIPILGPGMSKGGHQFKEGDISGGIGTTLGVGTQAALMTPNGQAAAGAIADTVKKPIAAAVEKVSPRGILADRMAQAPAGDMFTRQEVHDAARANGINLDLADATDSKAAKSVKKVQQYSITGEGAYDEAGQANRAQLQDWADRSLGEHSDRALSREAVGTIVQKRLLAHQGELADGAGYFFNMVDKDIGAMKPNTNLKLEVSEGKTIRQMAKEILDNNKSYFDEFPEQKSGDTARAWKTIENIANGKGSTWSQFQMLRSDLLKAVQSPDLVGSRAEGWLKHLEGGISEMLDRSAQSLSSTDAQLYQKGNARWRAMKETYDNPQHPFYHIVRALDGTTAGDMASRLKPDYLRTLRDVLGDANFPDFQRAQLARLLEPTEGQGYKFDTLNQRISRTDMPRLAEIFGPAKARDLQLMGRVARKVTYDYNPSGTAKKLAGAGELLNVVTNPIGGAVELGANYVTSKAMNNPRVVDYLTQKPGEAAARPPADFTPPTAPTAVPPTPAPTNDPALSAADRIIARANPSASRNAGPAAATEPAATAAQPARTFQRGDRVVTPRGEGEVTQLSGIGQVQVKLADGKTMHFRADDLVAGSAPQPPAAAAPAAAAPAAAAPASTAAAATKRAPSEVLQQTPAQAAANRLAGHDGSTTTLLTPSGEMPAQYRLVEADTLQPSHNPYTFGENPAYPKGVQERDYRNSREAQARVMDQAENYDPRYTVNTNPDAVNGPPIITPDGVVLGGNSRTMSTQRLYRLGDSAVYRDALKQQAAQFGLDPAAVDGMQSPVLVREIAAPENVDHARRLGSELNKSMTGALGSSEKAVSAGKNIKPQTLQEITDALEQLGDGATLRQLMEKRGRDIVNKLQRDGVITDRERPQFVDTTNGGLNDTGKEFVEKALLGSVVDDANLMDKTPKAVLGKLEGSLADIATLGGRADEYNLTPLLREALENHADIAAHNSSVELHLGQTTMFGPQRNPAVDALVRALGENPKQVRKRFRQFAQDSKVDVANQGMLGMMEAPSASGAFNSAFGTNLSAEEFSDALINSWKKDAYSGKVSAATAEAPRPAASNSVAEQLTQNPSEATQIQPTHEPQWTPVERYYEQDEHMHGDFWGPRDAGYADYGSKKIDGHIDEKSMFKGTDSRELADKAGYLDDPLSPEGQRLLAEQHDAGNIKTLRDLEERGDYGLYPEVYFQEFQKAAERHLKAKGYKGAHWSFEDDLSPDQYQVWDHSAIRHN